jgi:LIM domain kinase 1
MKLNQENILEKTDQNILNKELFECEINKKDLEIDFENILGKGSFGNVYKGKWFGTEVAIKEMIEIEDENIIKLISREISILRNVRHPNIIQFIGICRCDYGFFIITELIEGGDLRRLLKSDKNLSWKDIIKIAIDICSAMNYLHAREFLHRDLKSKNILIENSYKAKLCDFDKFCERK